MRVKLLTRGKNKPALLQQQIKEAVLAAATYQDSHSLPLNCSGHQMFLSH